MQSKSEELKWDNIKIGKPLKKLPRNFVALDIESMVVPDHKHGLILSIGIAKFEDNKFVSSQNIYINNSKNTKKPRHFNMAHFKIQPRKDKSTGISLEHINRGIALGDAMNVILQLLKDNIVVGHDVVNDLKLLTFNMFRFRLKNYACFANIDYYDTLLNEKDFDHELPNMALKSLSDYYNVRLLHPHNSEQDATASGFVAIGQEISRKEVSIHETTKKL